MSTCVNGRRPALRVGLIATVMVLGANVPAAAQGCLPAPNRAPGPGGHWYFRSDPYQDRKCWYLVEPAPRAPAAEAPLGPSSPYAPTTPNPPQSLDSIFSFFSSTPVPPPANPAMPAVRPGDDVTPRQPRTAHPSDAQQAALTPKPHRPPPARAPLARADDQGTSPLTEAQREALFQEFLRWKGRQSSQ